MKFLWPLSLSLSLGLITLGCGGKNNTFGTVSNVDIFSQRGSSSHVPIDILWVIDNSGSMNDNQKELAKNFNRFIQFFSSNRLKVPFKMAIITTDNPTNRDTQNRLNSRELQKNSSGFIQYFKDLVRVGSGGNDTEKGLLMSQKFLQKYPFWPNPNAHLIIIYVSDENDFSGGPPSKYISYFKSLKGDHPQRVKAFALVPLSASRYKEVVQKTKGLFRSIHQSFESILKDFGDQIATLSSVFTLRDGAGLKSIKVYVNDVRVPSEYYDYLKDGHAIRFKEGHIPALNSTIKIHYTK